MQNLNETFTEIIGRVRGFKVKAASKEKQAAFKVLNAWQGKTHYLLALKIEQDKLINGLM
jgi:hypothetical protein